MKDKNTEKYRGNQYEWDYAVETIREAQKRYTTSIFMAWDDVTRRQATDEFLTRLAEFYGVTIVFNREPKETDNG